MPTENKNMPAFPMEKAFNQSESGFTQKFGLTKREWFAGMAMQGICANQSSVDNNSNTSHEWAATKAVAIADEILKQL